MKKKYLMAGNWKMHPIPVGALEQGSVYHSRSDMDIIVFPTFLDLAECVKGGLMVGGQYGHPEEQGAHTGDISMAMLKVVGCRYVLCGHSERRAGHGETDEFVAEQVAAALEAGLHPIVCIGETWEDRRKHHEQTKIERQLKTLPLESDLTIAYEPVWAISGGDPSKPAATPDDAQTVHAFIRSALPADRREKTRILYGGSMKPENAQELLKQPDIDGGLIGGASLDVTKFKEIITIAESLMA